MHCPPGTRYSNSVIYDEATDRVNEHGDTIFVQRRPDGTPTGSEAVVIGGTLVGLEIAGDLHRRNAEAVALELRDALKAAIEWLPHYHSLVVHQQVTRDDLATWGAGGERSAVVLLQCIDVLAKACR